MAVICGHWNKGI